LLRSLGPLTNFREEVKGGSEGRKEGRQKRKEGSEGRKEGAKKRSGGRKRRRKIVGKADANEE
jgi:hypothetical protein